MRKPTTAADGAPYRVTIVTLDNHLASAVERARRTLRARDARSWISTSTPPPTGTIRRRSTPAGNRSRKSDIIVATMLFMEEHAEAVLPALQARRDHCDAILGCMSAPQIVKLTRVGRLNMDGAKRGAFDFLKKLRGGKPNRAPAARRSSRCCAGIPENPALHSGPGAGSARLFPDAAILARGLRRERRQPRALPRQPLRRRRARASARRAARRARRSNIPTSASIIRACPAASRLQPRALPAAARRRGAASSACC